MDPDVSKWRTLAKIPEKMHWSIAISSWTSAQYVITAKLQRNVLSITGQTTSSSTALSVL
jgi:hypothetical protein